MSFNITLVASGYQEIHPYSAMNIDSVKINTSLIMMKECQIRKQIDKDGLCVTPSVLDRQHHKKDLLICIHTKHMDI